MQGHLSMLHGSIFSTCLTHFIGFATFVISPPPPMQAQAPSAAQTLIDQRQSEVRALEAAWAAQRAEVEQHLVDVTHTPRVEAERAGVNLEQAKLAREISEIKLIEYEQGIYLQNQATAKGEIALAESYLKKAKDRLDWSVLMKERGGITEVELLSAELSHQKAIFTKEQAETKLSILEKYTRHKELKSLTTEIENRKAEELSAQENYVQAMAKVKLWQERAALLKSTVSEAHVTALLVEVGALQTKVVTLLEGVMKTEKIDGIAVAKALRDAAEVQKTIAETRQLQDAARVKLSEALDLAKLVQVWRDDLRETEAKLRKAREDLARLKNLNSVP